MQQEQALRFGPYRLAPHTGQLWRGSRQEKLTLKAAAVLRQLVEHAGHVVTKEELFAAVWPNTVVSEAALTACIQELRQVLHDKARTPRYLETVHRRGFRFLGKVVSSQQEEAANQKAKGKNQKAKVEDFFPAPSPQLLALTLVGREPDLAFLHERLAKALAGERQLVFVTGEPGIGKTTLLTAFDLGVRGWGLGVGSPLSSLPWQAPDFSSFLPPNPQPLIPGERLWWGQGQCIEHYGAGEAYLPILEALGRLCRESDGKRLIELLHQHAPTWLVQMPALLSAQELETLHHKTQGVTRERMLRELAEALEVITAERPLVLVLEDLHWSDVSTLELLSMLARRREAARLFVLGSYRPVEVLTRDHPLKAIKQELQIHGQCEELALDFLREEAVAEYLAQRFEVGAVREPPLRKLAHVIHRRTDGNPLFMVNVVNELVARGMISQRDGHWEVKDELEDGGIGVPVNLRQLIEQQIARVSPEERTILEAASVTGAEFSAVAVAAGTGHSAEAIETYCDGLVRREQFLRARGTSEWPDGTVAARYGFVHALYQEVLYEQISANRRGRLHKQIGEQKEQGHGTLAGEIATELAVHFERGRDYERAVRYRQRAGENARRRNAHQAAADHFTRGLELLTHLPETPERAHQELVLQTALGPALVVTKGLGSHEARTAYDHARELCQRIGETPRLFPILYGLSAYYVQQEEMITARDFAEQCLTLAERQQAAILAVAAHRLLVSAWYWSGCPIRAHEHCERGLALYDSQQWRSLAHVYGMDCGVSCLSIGAWALWYLGYPDQALKRTQAALALAREVNHLYTLAWALNATSWTHWYRREGQKACMLADEAIALSTAQGFPHWLAMGQWMRGQALIELGRWEEGTVQLRHGLEAYQTTGAMIATRGFGRAELARGYGHRGQSEEGLRIITEALTELNQVRHYEAEIYRIKGELTLQSQTSLKRVSNKSKASQNKSKNTDPRSLTPDPQGEAEECFLKAIDIARKQQAKSLELRASTSLARVWQQQSKTKQARKLLSEIYNWFTEGFDTKDLQEAKALLNSLESRV